MTTALYRRYRPDTFAEVIGQEHVTEPLMQALRADRVNHAYLFSGPRGCGKTTSARILARCLNCAEGPTPTPCGTCDSCVELGRGGPGSLDVVEIDAASHGGVDDARDLRERATFAPARDRYKIFILDEAHMVTPQGFNALLKIVEEPPEHVKFIFATTEPDKVIGTIRSRTHHYPFRLVGPDTLQPYLEQMCVAEGVAVGSGVLPLVVRAGGGSVRDSLSVLDQLVAGADASGIDYGRAVALLGYTHSALLDDVVDAIAARDGASAFRVVDRVVSSGHEPRRFVEDLLERLRDLIVIAASGDAARAVLRDLPADQLERMYAQAGVLGASELSRSADLANAALSEMTGATSPRLHLELLVARLLLPAADDGAVGLGARLDRVERELGPDRVGGARAAAPVAAAPGVAAPAVAPVAVAAVPVVRADAAVVPEPVVRAEPAVVPEPAAVEPPDTKVPDAEPPTDEPPTDEPPTDEQPTDEQPTDEQPQSEPPRDESVAHEPAVPVVSSGLDAEVVRRRWPEVLQTLRGLRMATWVLVSQNAQVAEVTADKVLLGFTTPQLATTFRTGPHPENVQRALHETLGLDVRVETALAVAPSEGGRAAGGSADDDRSAEGTVGSAASTDPGRVSTSDAEASWSAPARPVASPTAQSPSSGTSGSSSGTSGPSSGTSGQQPHARGPEPEDRAQRSAGRPTGSSRTGSGGPRTGSGGPRSGADRGRAPAAPTSVDEGEDADPDDPDLASTGLVGAPLIAQMLGGTVIDEIPDGTG
ncbi:DNA polymerase III subunit gamma and tau [Cellulomonas sp. KRMCY2]|uniref:DNA polymerase III subunit gamma and tau n=1 Tax=Cellulomonas sp. KRMCY2 TaxID=1304865 RepID=UPI00045E85EA|nr:DNA polymerase III subunit gamma and tau [Cellulomonas sp. KRMCY2]